MSNLYFFNLFSHADGSIKFWDASSVNMQVLYKMKTAKLFEKPRMSISVPPPTTAPPASTGSSSAPGSSAGDANKTGNNNNGTENHSEDPFAIDHITFNAESRILCIAGGSSQVVVFRFHRQEQMSEVSIIEVPMNYDELEPSGDQTGPEIQTASSALIYGGEKGSNSERVGAIYTLKAKTGHHKRASGFQADLIAISPWIDRRTPPYRVTSMCHNAHASL